MNTVMKTLLLAKIADTLTNGTMSLIMGLTAGIFPIKSREDAKGLVEETMKGLSEEVVEMVMINWDAMAQVTAELAAEKITEDVARSKVGKIMAGESIIEAHKK